MCIKSEFKEICVKLATNGQSDKGFLLTSKVCPQRVFCPCTGAIYMYKIIRNVYKIRFQRDHFGTFNIWAKRKGLSVAIKFLSPMGCLPLPGAIYHKFPKYSDTQKFCCNNSKTWTMWLYHRVMSPNDADGMANSVDPDQTAPLGVWSGSALFAQAYLSENLGSLRYMQKTHIKNGKKSDFKKIFLNWQQIAKVIRAFCWHQNFVPKGLSVPALGLYTCIKSFKMCLKSYFKEIVLKLATNRQSDKGFCWHQHLSTRGCLPLPWGYIHV